MGREGGREVPRRGETPTAPETGNYDENRVGKKLETATTEEHNP